MHVRSEEEITHCINEAISDEIFGKTFQEANEQLDSEEKKQDKLTLINQAFELIAKDNDLQGRMDKIYQFAALISGGRIISDIGSADAYKLLANMANLWTQYAFQIQEGGLDEKYDITDEMKAFAKEVFDLRFQYVNTFTPAEKRDVAEKLDEIRRQLKKQKKTRDNN
jgi:hypothetical protein